MLRCFWINSLLPVHGIVLMALTYGSNHAIIITRENQTWRSCVPVSAIHKAGVAKAPSIMCEIQTWLPDINIGINLFKNFYLSNLDRTLNSGIRIEDFSSAIDRYMKIQITDRQKTWQHKNVSRKLDLRPWRRRSVISFRWRNLMLYIQCTEQGIYVHSGKKATRMMLLDVIAMLDWIGQRSLAIVKGCGL